MNKRYEKLFEKYTLNNGVEIKNRLVVAPMTLFAANEDGTFSTGDIDFMKIRGENMGMFIVEATLIAEGGRAFIRQPQAISENELESLKEVANLLKAQGTKAILQLHHGGKQAIKEINKSDKVAPSDDVETGSRALTVEEIENLIKAFGTATELAIKAGFDGVEIHGANGYLIQQFYSAQSNKRTDEWGGSREKRIKFPLEVIKSVNEAKNKYNVDEFIVGYRFSPEEPGENGLTMEDTLYLVEELTKQPLQYLHISLHEFNKKVRRGGDTNLARIQLIHEKINGKLPLIGIGALLTGEQIVEAFETGWAEFIALGKAVITNPNIATLLYEGKEDEIEVYLDFNKNDKYLIPEYLWNLCHQGLAMLPPLKDKEWKPMDI